MGKTVMAINHLLRAAVLCPKKAPRYAYLAPTYRQAKAVAWDYLKQFAGGIPGIKFHETELRCDLPNGGRISLLGAENPDSLRGIYLDGCFMDEVADMPEKVFPEVIRPALSDREGFCYFVGTPKGQNAFFEMYEQASNNDDWYTAVHKASDTAILNATELRSAKEAMTNDQYAQEYECSWVANVPGAIFGKELEAAMEEGRISRVPHDPTVKVDTFWDLGVGDSTAIWFVQSVGRAIHFIDCYENRGEGLPHYVNVLSKKNYLYGDHFAPHDIEVRELGSGKSRREIAWDLGLNFRVVPKLPLEDGLHAAQMLIPRSWFDAEKCKQGLVALRQYHRGYNERARSFRTTPVHDWSSHFADALRYTAVGIKETVKSGRPPQIHAEMDYNPFQQVGV
tara:strand:+ start:22 stop:1206 length:1185 start_codon:yes stop_codon:yes gene_type:complete